MTPAAALLSGFVLIYRGAISPVLPGCCRFQPTCSAYALDAMRRFGALRGGWLAIRRIGRCHPWGGSGFDPLPDIIGPTPQAFCRPIADATESCQAELRRPKFFGPGSFRRGSLRPEACGPISCERADHTDVPIPSSFSRHS